MDAIYVTAAELNGRFTGHPQHPLSEMMVAAARHALDAAGLTPGAVDALYAGAMGNFAPEGFVGPIPIRLANALRLRNADITPMLVGSSEAGAWALRLAFEAIRRTPVYRHLLVVAGEQMNPVASARALSPDQRMAARQARNRAISEILDASELAYGLTMLRAGDLMIDPLRVIDGWGDDDLLEGLLPLLALSKYSRVADYPSAHLYGKVSPSRALYRSAPRLASWLTLHDVTPTSSGAVALVLSREPGPESLEIVGMGQSVAPLSLASRRGDPRQARTVRQAISRACRDAGVGLSWLRDADFALVHDAFPSIEYFFLKELGFSAAEIVARVTSGWSNPFGGLKTCGHALGASGLFQVAKAHHRVFKSARYLTAEARSRLPEVSRCFATSVGGPLTNVVVSILQRRGAAGGQGPADPGLEAYDEQTRQCDADWEARVRGRIPPHHGLVLAATHIRTNDAFGDHQVPLLQVRENPWVVWCEVGASTTAGSDPSEASPKAFAWSETRLEPGQIVRLRPDTLAGADYLRAQPTGQRLDLAGPQRPPVDEALRAAMAERLAQYD